MGADSELPEEEVYSKVEKYVFEEPINRYHISKSYL